ncbi:hypothetical protein AgCh_023988 [Apium graveolens]
MTVEEAVGSFKVHEERIRGHANNGGSQLLITEKEWLERERFWSIWRFTVWRFGTLRHTGSETVEGMGGLKVILGAKSCRPGLLVETKEEGSKLDLKGEKFSEIVGSPYYMAPEVLRRNYGLEVDVSVFSLIGRTSVDTKCKEGLNIPLGDIVRTRLKQFSLMNRFKKKALQKYLQSITIREEEMRVKRRDVELWMSHRILPESLRERIKCYEHYQWKETRGVDEEFLIRDLPKDV